MPWINLFIAGLCEVGWAIGLKYTGGLTKFWPSLWTILAMLASFFFLARAANQLPIGTAYAVWTGMGVIGTVIFGMVYLNESRDWLRLVSLGLVLFGILGLKLSMRTVTVS